MGRRKREPMSEACLFTKMMRLDRYSRCIKKYLFVSLLYKYAEKFFIQCKSYSLTSVFRLNEKLFSARHCDHHNS